MGVTMMRVNGSRVPRVTLTKARCLHCTPTGGKSTLLASMNESRVVALDTDVIMMALTKMGRHDPMLFWEANEMGRRDDTVDAAVDAAKVGAAFVAARWLELGGFLVTNLWNYQFAGLRIDVTFGVPGAVAQARSKARARPGEASPEGFPLALTTKWFNRWESGVSELGIPAFVLEADDYLGEVVSVPDDVEVPDVSGRPDEAFWEVIFQMQREADGIARRKYADAQAVSGSAHRILIRCGDLWTKLSWKAGVLRGFEVYSDRPSAEYWTQNYGHPEPAVLEFDESVYIDLKDGTFMAFWATMNIGPASGVERIGKQPSKGRDVTEDVMTSRTDVSAPESSDG